MLISFQIQTFKKRITLLYFSDSVKTQNIEGGVSQANMNSRSSRLEDFVWKNSQAEDFVLGLSLELIKLIVNLFLFLFANVQKRLTTILL